MDIVNKFIISSITTRCDNISSSYVVKMQIAINLSGCCEEKQV